MSARELTIPESVRHLDGEAVIDALSRHNGNISAAAKDLGVPSADFRAFLRPNPRYQAAANELIERRQDLADAAILEALEHPDLRYRLPAAMFQSRYSTVAAARGWITNAPVDAEPVTAGPRRIEIRWGALRRRRWRRSRAMGARSKCRVTMLRRRVKRPLFLSRSSN
jgi:hypothetical protein